MAFSPDRLTPRLFHAYDSWMKGYSYLVDNKSPQLPGRRMLHTLSSPLVAVSSSEVIETSQSVWKAREFSNGKIVDGSIVNEGRRLSISVIEEVQADRRERRLFFERTDIPHIGPTTVRIEWGISKSGYELTYYDGIEQSFSINSRGRRLR